MHNPLVIALYLIVMIALIVGVDVAFFRHAFWPRLAINAGVVLVFVAVFFRLGGHPWAPGR